MKIDITQRKLKLQRKLLKNHYYIIIFFLTFSLLLVGISSFLVGRFPRNKGVGDFPGVCKISPDGVNCIGTGFLVENDLIITAGHVVNDLGVDAEVTLIFKDETVYNGIVERIEYDPNIAHMDVALVRLEKDVENPEWLMTLGDSERVDEGEEVRVPGYGYDCLYDAPRGSISAIRPDENILVSDVDINPGHSGAPVYSLTQKSIIGIIIKGPKPDTGEGKKAIIAINKIIEILEL